MTDRLVVPRSRDKPWSYRPLEPAKTCTPSRIEVARNRSQSSKVHQVSVDSPTHTPSVCHRSFGTASSSRPLPPARPVVAEVHRCLRQGKPGKSTHEAYGVITSLAKARLSGQEIQADRQSEYGPRIMGKYWNVKRISIQDLQAQLSSPLPKRSGGTTLTTRHNEPVARLALEVVGRPL